MKVNYREYWEEFARVKNLVRDVAGDMIEIYEVTEKPIELGVNWASIGTVSVEDAIEFAEKIKAVAEIVEDFKYNGYEIEW